MQIIAEHLIEIQVLDFENSLLQMKNKYLDSPTCEPQYARKFLNFCRMICSSNGAQRIIPENIPLSIYDSDDFKTKPQILSNLELTALRPSLMYKNSKEAYTTNAISSLKCFGNLIDGFLASDEDFWLLDYMINALFSDGERNTYHVFKVMSLIEMLIVSEKNNGKTKGEMERKLPQFLSAQIEPSLHVLFSEVMRKLRNKIGHGDLKAVQQLLQQYRQSFMGNFWFDECEYSVENWVLAMPAYFRAGSE